MVPLAVQLLDAAWEAVAGRLRFTIAADGSADDLAGSPALEELDIEVLTADR